MGRLHAQNVTHSKKGDFSINIGKSCFKHVCQWIIENRVNRNCRKKSYLAEFMYIFIFVQKMM